MQKRKKCLCQLLLIILTCWGSVTCFIHEIILLKIKFRGVSVALFHQGKEKEQVSYFRFYLMANNSVPKLVVP